MAPRVAERAALAPADRSVLPMAVTKSTPVPPMITGKAWLTMLEIFWGVTRVPRVAMRNTPVSYTHLDVYKRQTLNFKELQERAKGRNFDQITVVSRDIFQELANLSLV